MPPTSAVPRYAEPWSIEAAGLSTVHKMCRVTATAYAPGVWAGVAPTWAALFDARPDASFFLSPAWVESWLQTFGETLRPRLLVFEDAGVVLGACLLTVNTEWKGPIPVRRMYLNTAGERPTLFVEWNALLCRPGAEGVVTAALADYLGRQRWNEFCANGISESAFGVIERALAGVPQAALWSVDYYVDLARLRATGEDYVRVLSRNTRDQLKRSLKLYEAIGPLRVTAATDSTTAIAMLAEMVELHQATWISRGQRGAFASPRILEFHHRLIRRAPGAVQLLRVTAGDEVIGVLHYFVERGRVYFYQAGLRYRDDNRYKPGFVTHALAIRYWQEHGLDEYDFLAGEEFDVRYKKSLSTDTRRLGWIVFRRPGLRLATIAFLRRLKRRFLTTSLA
jgi:CelD/BcsL family acetyltransferase involved in cellulose biosynthesis